MSGGAFNYEEFHLLQLRDVIEERRDEELGEDLSGYMLDLIEDLTELHTKIKKLDLYLSGDTSEYK